MKIWIALIAMILGGTALMALKYSFPNAPLAFGWTALGACTAGLVIGCFGIREEINPKREVKVVKTKPPEDS